MNNMDIDWFNNLSNKRILVTGASSDLGVSLLQYLINFDMFTGAHYFSNPSALSNFERKNVILLKGNLNNYESCYNIVDEFVNKAGSIDYFVNFVGGIEKPIDWRKLEWCDWQEDLNVNLSSSFFLAQRVVHYMQKTGGKIIFISTASAQHGGGSKTMPYGIAKAGVECMTKGMARDLAKDNILVNCIAPGFIMTKFHGKSGKTPDEIKKRLELIPIKKAGTPEDIAGAILYLLSDAGNYITGQILTISGGDWL